MIYANKELCTVWCVSILTYYTKQSVGSRHTIYRFILCGGGWYSRAKGMHMWCSPSCVCGVRCGLYCETSTTFICEMQYINSIQNNTILILCMEDPERVLCTTLCNARLYTLRATYIVRYYYYARLLSVATAAVLLLRCACSLALSVHTHISGCGSIKKRHRR